MKNNRGLRPTDITVEMFNVGQIKLQDRIYGKKDKCVMIEQKEMYAPYMEMKQLQCEI